MAGHGNNRHEQSDRLLRLPEALRLYPVSKSTWYQGVADGRYLPEVKLTSRAVAWRQSEIEALVRDAPQNVVNAR